jgi:uncharacterized delta-60 repeat protein
VISFATNNVVVENAGAVSFSGFATFSPGPAGESGQNLLGYTVSNNNNALFSVSPAVNNMGLLTFTPAPNSNGIATVTVIAQDDGGTANGGMDKSTSTFTITVFTVNHVPTVTLATNLIVVTTSAAQALANFATFSPGPTNESSQHLVGYQVSNNNPPLFSAQPAINNAGLLTFTPGSIANGSAVVTVIVQDDGGTANGGVDKSTNAFTIQVNQVIPGRVDSSFNPDIAGIAATFISTAVLEGDGNIVIGGSFSSVGGVARSNIARLNVDGTLDTAFDPNVNDSVWSAAIQTDGRILIAGGFTTIGGTIRNRIARVNANGTLDPGFTPNANGTVANMALQTDGRIVIGGTFTTVGGVTRNRIARLNADGALDPGFNPSANGFVRTIAAQADGQILIGGDFSTVAGVTRTRLARLNANGTLDATFNPGANSSVECLAVQADGKILVGGYFWFIGGVSRYSFVRLNQSGTLDSPFNADVETAVKSVAVQTDGKILIGGNFSTVGGMTRNRIARLNADGTLDTTFNSYASGEVMSVTVQADGNILIGGWFLAAGTEQHTFLARLVNNPAMQSLTAPAANRLEWLRGGASPEAQQVWFDISTDNGTNWSPLGWGSRISGGWALTNLSIPPSGLVRASALVPGGANNGSSFFAGAVIPLPPVANPSPRLTDLLVLGDGSFRFGFTAAIGSSFTARATTNLSLASSNCLLLGPATEISPGQFQFTDTAATNLPVRFYQIRSP